MPNFTARVRTSYRDVEGLVLSCTRDDVVEDLANPGYVREWINRAPGIPSQPFFRDLGDPTTYDGWRYSNPTQTVAANQPAIALTGGGQSRVQFDRARNTTLVCEPTTTAVPSAASLFGFGYQFTPGADASNSQKIFEVNLFGVCDVYRRNGSGNAQAGFGGGSFAVVAGDHPAGTFVGAGQTGASSVWQQDGGAFGAGTSFAEQIPVSSQLIIGDTVSATHPLDGILDSLHIWAGELSSRSLDFIWKTINEDAVAYGGAVYGSMAIQPWTDVTGDAALDQFDRLRPQTGRPHLYHRMTKPTGERRSFQLSAAVDGMVLNDTALGTDVFTWNVIEIPGSPAAIPLIYQDAGWSAIADISVDKPGHYTVLCTRANGGSIILHVDVEDV